MRVLFLALAAALVMGVLAGCPQEQDETAADPPMAGALKTPVADVVPAAEHKCDGDCDPADCPECAAKTDEASECTGDCEPETCDQCAAKAANGEDVKSTEDPKPSSKPAEAAKSSASSKPKSRVQPVSDSRPAGEKPAEEEKPTSGTYVNEDGLICEDGVCRLPDSEDEESGIEEFSLDLAPAAPAEEKKDEGAM